MSDSSGIAPRGPGAFQRALVRLLMRESNVVANEQPVEGFRLITLEGAALKGVQWRPGQKVQINQGRLFGDRTYTPLSWDKERGLTRLLVRAVGQGPGAQWAANVQPGDACQFAGPSAGVELDRPGRSFLFGDETSLGSMIAAATQSTVKLQAMAEVDDPDMCGDLLMQFGLTANFIRRCHDASHLRHIQEVIANNTPALDQIVLTGRASSIQRLHRALRSAGPHPRIVTKAYWSESKTGMS
jgi:NADPH-dependent ferric siderophore reductase